MTTLTVQEAQANLAAAEAVAAKRKRDSALAEIQRLSAEGVELQAEFERIAPIVRDAQNERLALNGQLIRARQMIEVYSEPLDPATFPSAAALAEHARQLELWQAEQRELLRRHEAAVMREGGRMRCIEIQNALVRLQSEIGNQQNIARGLRPGEVRDSGLHFVTEDFIGHTQMPPR